MTSKQHRPRSPLTLTGADPLPEVHIDPAGVVAMSDEQYEAAVVALAVLIEGWRATRRPPATDAAADDAADADADAAADGEPHAA